MNPQKTPRTSPLRARDRWVCGFKFRVRKGDFFLTFLFVLWFSDAIDLDSVVYLNNKDVDLWLDISCSSSEVYP